MGDLGDAVRASIPAAKRDLVGGSTISKFVNAMVYGRGRLTAEQVSLFSFWVLASEYENLNNLRAVYFIGNPSRTVAPVRPGANAEQREEYAAGVRHWKSTMFILATMSRVPGVSGSYDDLYFHPPGRLGMAIATSRSARTQALNEMNTTELRTAEADRLRGG